MKSRFLRAALAGSLFAAVLLGACFAPRSANAQQFILDTGTPAGSNVTVLSSSQFLAGEFSATAGQNVSLLSAYLTQGVGQPGDTFLFDIYSGLAGNTFFSRSSQRETPLLSATGTFTTNGWNSTAVNWTPATSGDYWLALQVPSTAFTHGLDAPDESSASTGSVPAIAFAYAGSSGQYTSSGAPPIGLEVTTVPEPGALGLGGVALLLLLAAQSFRHSPRDAA